MDRAKMEKMNELLDVLFYQLEALPDDKKGQAGFAVAMWKAAKTSEFLGLGPMEARHEYISAYGTLKDMGLEVGGMIPPYMGANV